MIARKALVAAAFLGLFLWVFAEALPASAAFAFRDAAHFYFPLYEYVQEEWAAGRVPLWNPFEDLGMPLAGNAAAAVFYPGRLIFLLPLPYATSFKLYIFAHLFLAAAGTYFLARRWRFSVEAAAMAALSYAFSGNVLIQYSNVVFLVGAAWLPLAVWTAEGALRRRRLAAAGGLGAVLAMMTLGGDPQAAYHAGLLAVLYGLVLRQTARRRGAAVGSPAGTAAGPGASSTGRAFLSGTHRPGSPACSAQEEAEDGKVVWWLSPAVAPWQRLARLKRRRCVLLAGAVSTAFLLAAVQLLPSMTFHRRSDRAASATARSIYEIPRHLGRADARDRIADGLLCRRLPPGSHHAHVYLFSVGPWRLVEFFWPNVAGRQFPLHRRWLDVLPAEGRLWTPSLYMGLLPVVLALSAWRLRGGQRRQVWMSWTVLLFVLGSFGGFGLGWLAAEVRSSLAGPAAAPGGVGHPVGGVYWLMTVFLPGYIQFRFPAKLLVVAALGLSLLAGFGWEALVRGRGGGVHRWLAAFALVSGTTALLVSLAAPALDRLFAQVPANVVFGPLERGGAMADLFGAFAQSALVGGLAAGLCVPSVAPRRWAAAAAVLLVAVDLGIANRWMVATAAVETWQRRSRAAEAIAADPAAAAEPAPVRVHRRGLWVPQSWRREGSPQRFAESIRWERDTLWPKYNLPWRIAAAEVHGTMRAFDYEVFLAAAVSGGRWEATGAEYLVLPPRPPPPRTRAVEAFDAADAGLFRLVEPLPRAWIADHVVRLDPADDPDALRARTAEVLAPAGRPRDLRRSAVVEADPHDFPVDETTRHAVAGESCRVVVYEPQCVEIEAHLAAPGLVVLADQYFPGWELWVHSEGEPPRQEPILRTHRVMRGAWLGPGRHRLVYQYRPRPLRLGAAVSGLAWLAVFCATALLRRWR